MKSFVEIATSKEFDENEQAALWKLPLTDRRYHKCSLEVINCQQHELYF